MFDKRGIDELHNFEECVGDGKNQKREGGCEYQCQMSSNVVRGISLREHRLRWNQRA
jgi:hypothetical protein